MTCIIGLRDRKNKRLYIGGDSCAGDIEQYTTYTIKNPKVFSKGDFLIGYTTSFRMGQIIERFLTPPPIPPNKKLYYYMIDDFIPEVIRILKEHNWSKNTEGREHSGVFIVGIKDSLFLVDDDYQVAEYQDDFVVCGCGKSYAEGSLFNDDSSKAAIIRAFNAAAYFSAYVIPPFKIISRTY